jgi:hypothetical protein
LFRVFFWLPALGAILFLDICVGLVVQQ